MQRFLYLHAMSKPSWKNRSARSNCFRNCARSLLGGWVDELVSGEIVGYFLNRDLDCAGNPVRREGEVDRTTKLMRNQLTNQAGSITVFSRDRYRRPTCLSPYNFQASHSILPAHRHTASGKRQSLELGPVRQKLLKVHRQRLGCCSDECNVGPAGRRIFVCRIGSQL